MTIRIVIPGTPAAKGRPRGTVVAGTVRMFTPAKTRTREGVVASLAADAMAGRPALTGPVAVTVLAVLPIAKSWPKRDRAAALSGDKLPTGRPDLDNMLKLVSDGCNGIVWADDSQIAQIAARKIYGAEPRTVVTVEEFQE